VSNTPRTDQECGDYDRSGCWKSYIEGECVQSDFARQLERELNAANESFRKLNIHALDLAARIKRLEEVGDEVVINYVNSLSAFEMWRKAKEVKP
jgi:hypothetical protein